MNWNMINKTHLSSRSGPYDISGCTQYTKVIVVVVVLTPLGVDSATLRSPSYFSAPDIDALHRRHRHRHQDSTIYDLPSRRNRKLGLRC